MLLHKPIEDLKIPFSPPYIDDDVIAEVMSALQSGWITSGPKVKELEERIATLSGNTHVACVNSWTSGAMLVLKWLGVGQGDEVIMPAYTYSATALCVMHVGATPVMVDIQDDFSIDPAKVAAAITERTKAVLVVDIAGWPCDYDAINTLINSAPVREKYKPANDIQKKLGRPLLLSDAAHSMGALYNNKPSALASDVTVYSLHAVKNITTAEGGAICLNLPEPFRNNEVHGWMKINSLNGQTKDAFSKMQTGGWKYDIISDGLKVNLPDVCAAIGLAQLKKYDALLMPERKRVFDHYNAFFGTRPWAIMPPYEDEERSSSRHLFLLRIKDITEAQRDDIIQKLADKHIATNVHFIPMPMLTLFREMGYDINDFPAAYRNYACEISLPVYPQLTDEQCAHLEEHLELAYHEVVK